MENFLEWLQHYDQWVTHYGYVAIFLALFLGIVGLPIPDETLLTFAGYMVFKGNLRFLPTVVTAFLGTMSGITTSYLIGRTLRGEKMRPLPAHHGGPTRTRPPMVQPRRKMDPDVRVFHPRRATSDRAGGRQFEARVPVFAVFAYTGGFFWSLLFICLGYGLGEGWAQTSAQTHRYILVGIGVLAACILVFVLIHQRRRIWK